MIFLNLRKESLAFEEMPNQPPNSWGSLQRSSRNNSSRYPMAGGFQEIAARAGTPLLGIESKRQQPNAAGNKGTAASILFFRLLQATIWKQLNYGSLWARNKAETMAVFSPSCLQCSNANLREYSHSSCAWTVAHQGNEVEIGW